MQKFFLIVIIAIACISMTLCDWQSYMMIGYDHGYKDALIRVYNECDGCFAIDSAMLKFPVDSTEFRASHLGGF